MSATERNETLLRMASVPLYPSSLPGQTAVGQSTEGIGHWVQAPVVGRISFLTPIPQLVQTHRGRDPGVLDRIVCISTARKRIKSRRVMLEARQDVSVSPRGVPNVPTIKNALLIDSFPNSIFQFYSCTARDPEPAGSSCGWNFFGPECFPPRPAKPVSGECS